MGKLKFHGFFQQQKMPCCTPNLFYKARESSLVQEGFLTAQPQFLNKLYIYETFSCDVLWLFVLCTFQEKTVNINQAQFKTLAFYQEELTEKDFQFIGQKLSQTNIF